MLKEIYQYLSTPARPYVRKLGLLKESVAMEARYQRCQIEWQSHYSQCQQAILQTVNKTAVKNTIVILGAGSLRDIPLENLAKSFKRVILIDLLFLKQARNQVAKYPNIQLVEMDVTNGLEALLNVGSIDEMLVHLYENSTKLEFDADCIISLNLVTQIPLVPVARMVKKFNADPAKLEKFAKLLIQQHLDLLNAQKGVKCLIADREISECDKQGKEIDCFNPAWDVIMPKVDTKWNWVAVPYKESSANVQKTHLVGCSIWLE